MDDLKEKLSAYLAQIDDPDHFVACRALKELGKLNAPGPEVLERVFQALSSPVLAVERTALRALIRFGKQGSPLMERLLKQFSRRLEDGGGCDYGCCGYAAYYAPAALYVETLLAMGNQQLIEATIHRTDEKNLAESSQEMLFLISEFQ